MTLNQLANKNLVWIAGGTVAGMTAGAMIQGKINNAYAREIAGGSMFIAGSLMIAKGNTTIKKLGSGFGSAGLSLLGTGVYNRVAGETSLPNFSQGEVLQA